MARRHSRRNWLQSLPSPLVIPDVAVLRTLADARSLMRHLPADRRDRSTGRYVATELERAANGAAVGEAVIALRLVLMLEGVECGQIEGACRIGL